MTGKDTDGDHPDIKHAQITVLTHATFIGKRFEAINGTLVKRSQATFHDGKARALAAPDAATLARILDLLTPRHVLTLGQMKDGRTSAHVVTGAKLGPASDAISRSADYFEHAAGQGWLLLDHDTKDMPTDVQARVQALGGGLAAIKSIWPDLADADLVVRPSSSGGVHLIGNDPSIATGFHGFVRVKDVSLSKQILDTLTARAWLAGLAWHTLGKNGALLERSIIDAAVHGPERLIFTAPPELGAGVARTAPQTVVQAGVAVDGPAMPDADALALLIRESRHRLKPDAEKATARFVEGRVAALVAEGVPRVDAERSIRDRMQGRVLHDHDILQMSDGSHARVGDILDSRFAGPGASKLSLPDPDEGLEYGKTTAAIMWGAGHAQPTLVSHAHGQITRYTFARHAKGAAPAPDIPALRPTLRVDQARARLQTEVREALRRPGVTLIEATLGLGKTTATIEALPDLFAEADAQGIAGAVVMAFPQHALGRQVWADVKAAVPGRSIVQLYGPEAKDPDDPDATVCKQLRAYQERASLLLDTRPLCENCPFAGDCLHLKGIGARADIYITSHERLKAARTPLGDHQTLLATIIDENPLNALVSAHKRPVPLAALMAAPTTIRRKAKPDDLTGDQGDLMKYRDKLQATITAHGVGYLRLADLQGWTEQDARSARGLEYGRKIEDEAHPEIAHNKTITAAVGVFGEIERSIVDGVAENGRLQIRHGEHGPELVLSGMRPISGAYKVAPVVMLDATAQPDIAAMLAGETLAHRAEIRATENIHVVQDPSISGAKSHFFAKGETTGNVARARYYIKACAMAARVAVISNQATVAAMDLPADILTGHFNALRGLNAMQDIDHLIVIGRTQPPPQAIDRLVAAIWGVPIDGVLVHLGTAWRHTLTDGKARMVQAKAATHTDPRGEMILRLIRDAEVMQAIGRVRGVNRSTPVRVTVLSDAVLDHPVEIKAMKNDLRVAGILGPMLDRGVAFLSATQAAKAYPDLYASKQAASKVFDGISDWSTFPIESLYGKGCPVVEICVPRSRNTTLALVAPWVSDAETEIRRYLATASIVATDIIATADQVTAIAPPALPPARTVDAGAQPAQVLKLHDPGWHRHRAKIDSMDRCTLAVYHRIKAAGIWLRFSTNQVAVALHETSDAAKISAMLGMTPTKVEAALNDLFFLGLVDHDNRLDGPLALRKLVHVTSIDSPIMTAFIGARRRPMRMQMPMFAT
jgi:hypothetical protein